MLICAIEILNIIIIIFIIIIIIIINNLLREESHCHFFGSQKSQMPLLYVYNISDHSILILH